MKLFAKKYRKKTASFILTGYFFLFIFNILHYHPIDLYADDSIQSEKLAGNISDPFLPFSGNAADSNFQCIFHANYYNLHSVVNNLHNEITPTYFEEYFCKSIKYHSYTSHLNKTAYLRGPPSLS
jgi:hypothetical protein